MTGWRFWLFWGLAFLGFPIGGFLANVLVGAVTDPVRAGLAGALTGAVLGVAQWLVLKSRLPLPIWWVAATGAGMAVGLAIGTAWLGAETTGDALLWRAAATGVCLGIAQWLVLRPLVPQAALWIAAVGLGWVVGWSVTRGAGIDLSLRWSVFGATGALAFQLLTGLALAYLLRAAPGGP
jgi:hypothetical protein